MAKTNPARGMRDFLPADVRKREYVIGIIKQVYESYGYEPLETPAVENIDTLMGKYGEEGNQLIFKILKRGEKLRESIESGESSKSIENKGLDGPERLERLADLALRYDLTVPLARVVADRRDELPKFFKRYQIQPVWRADRPARGRFREFYQCDVDSIGSKSMIVEAELISAVSSILEQLGFNDFVIRLNHRDVLSKLLFTCEIPARQHSDALTAIDKLDKVGSAGVLKELREREIATEAAEMLVQFFVDSNSGSDTSMKFDVLEDFIGQGVDGSEELQQIVNLCQGNRHIEINYGLARGISYYTGTIMEINVPDLAGSLGGGGRYDGLIGMFGKEQIPACGFSLGLERILVVMDERGMFPPEIAESLAADVMVTIWNEDSIAESLKLASELRSHSLRVLVYPEPDKLGKQFKYASQMRMPFVCQFQDGDLDNGLVTLTDMRTDEKEKVRRQDLAAEINSQSAKRTEA